MRVCFFGKIPTSGDFVARGISVNERQYWDRWITTGLGFALHKDTEWPASGLRVSRNGQIGVIVKSRDKSGRVFPLLGLVTHEGGALAPKVANECLDALLPHLKAASAGDLNIEGLEASLSGLKLEISSQISGAGGLVWALGSEPISDEAPPETLSGFFVRDHENWDRIR